MREHGGNHISLAVGQSIPGPPAFNGEDYEYWKARMRLFFESTCFDMWDIIESGYLVPREGGVDVPKACWSPEQKYQASLNAKAKYYLACALSKSEFNKISDCSTAKDMWDTLAIVHEDTKDVKEAKLSIMTCRYEMFKMESHESIDQMFGRFQTITNRLKSLGKTIPSSHQVWKILRSLPKQWRPLVTAIQVAKDMATMNLYELIGYLKAYELELCEKDAEFRKGKNIAL